MTPSPDDIAAAAPRRRMSADARREQLLVAAREVFMRSGLSGTTVRDITDAADVNTALLYRHFESKEDVFDAAIAEPLEAALEGLIADARDASVYLDDPERQREIVVAVLERLLTAMSEIAPLLGVVLFSERGPAFYREHLAPAIGTVSEAAAIAQPLVGYRPYNTDLVATMIVGTCFMYGLRDLFGGDRVERGVLARELTDIVFDGLVPR